MQTELLVDALEQESARFAAAVAAAGSDTLVPCVDWTAAELTRHLGGIHRWTTDLVTGARTELDTSGDLTDAGPADAAALPAWFRQGAAELVAALRAAPDDLAVPTLMRSDSPRRFWARRQAHETAIHRADVELALAATPDVEPDLAQDGMSELLLGFGLGRPFAVPTQGRLALVADDGPSWLLTFGGERNRCRPLEAEDRPDAAVRGRSSQLYLWLWNRNADVTVDGDAGLAAQWTATVRIRRG